MKFAIPRKALGRSAVVLGLCLAVGTAFASTLGPTNVLTVTGGWVNNGLSGPYYGYVDDTTSAHASFNFPAGLALDSSGSSLFIADCTNDAVRLYSNPNNPGSGIQVYTFVYTNNGVSRPVGVAVDINENIYVLNRAKGTNGYVLEFTNNAIPLKYPTFAPILVSPAVTNNTIPLTNATAMAYDNAANLYVVCNSNTVVRVVIGGVSTIIASGTNSFGTIGTNLNLRGVAVMSNGRLALTDAGNNGIWTLDPTNNAVASKLTGFHNAGDTNGPPIIAAFNHPENIAAAGNSWLVVADRSNHKVKMVDAAGNVYRLFGVNSNLWWTGTDPLGHTALPGISDGLVDPNPNDIGAVQAREPFGLVVAADGSVYDTEVYYHLIRHITSTGLPPPPPLPPTSPTATAGYGQVVLTWSANSGATNYNVKRSTISGTETTIASTAGTSYTDTNVLDGITYFYVISALNASGESPNSSEVSAMPLFSPPPASLFVTATNFGLVSLGWSPSPGATGYHVKRSTSPNAETTIATASSTSYNDTTVANGQTYYYVVTAINSGGENPTNSPEVSALTPIPPPPPPRIGWYDFEGSVQNGFYSTLHPVSGNNPFVAHNPLLIAIDPSTNGVSTYYVTVPPYTNNTPLATVTNFGSTPPTYQDHQLIGSPNVNPLPSLALSNGLVTIEAANVDGVGQGSAVVSASFLFQVGTPAIGGNNAALFTVSDITTNVIFYYTLDGTDPTNAPPSQQVVSSNSVITLSLNGTTNILFQVRAFGAGALANYAVSQVAQAFFATNSFVPNTISFGTPNHEPSSHFLARPGQFYYAPVTLNLLPNFGTIYSLDFNVTVTNGLVNTNTGVRPPPVVNGAGIDFFSMLMSKVKPNEGRYFPPADGNWYLPIPPITFYPIITTNGPATNGVPTEFVNTNNNLLGIGWLYRTGFKYLATDTNGVVFLDFDTSSQDLTAFSIAHDTLFNEAGGTVIVGAYSFQVPTAATNGDKYFIQLGSPSATSDGVGAPGAGIFIQAPANNQAVTVSSPAYLVGDAAPFHWLNAGDFGDTNLDSSDVQQVYQSAILGVNMPPANSDLFAAMDSSGSLGFWDGANQYYTNSFTAYTNTFAIETLFDGNDQTINTNIFGDGNLDVSDLYVTFRRSLDPSLLWFERFWTNGQFVAVATTNLAFNTNIPSSFVTQSAGQAGTKVFGQTYPYEQSSVLFMAGDAQVTAGQSVQIPITANVLGTYPLRVLGLNVTVHPLDGSPDLTQPIQFTPSAGLGQPTAGLSGNKGNDTYAAAWLNSSIAGLNGNAIIGYLTVTLPANATSMSAYAVHFDRVSGSPNGLGSFPKQTFTGLITLSSRTNSTYNDGIPDSWRLRWFGTIYNLLSVSNACPSGDGVNNWKKYVAGVDPNTANDFPSLNTKSPVPPGAKSAIHWPSVYGKQYVVLSSPNLFSGSWTTNTIVSGTGGDMEYDDSSGGSVKFYRVQILP